MRTHTSYSYNPPELLRRSLLPIHSLLYPFTHSFNSHYSLTLPPVTQYVREAHSVRSTQSLTLILKRRVPCCVCVYVYVCMCVCVCVCCLSLFVSVRLMRMCLVCAVLFVSSVVSISSISSVLFVFVCLVCLARLVYITP